MSAFPKFYCNNVIPIRPDMPILPLLTMEEIRAMKLQRRNELRHIAEQIIAEAGWIEANARTICDNAKLVLPALIDAEAEAAAFEEQA